MDIRKMFVVDFQDGSKNPFFRAFFTYYLKNLIQLLMNETVVKAYQHSAGAKKIMAIMMKPLDVRLAN